MIDYVTISILLVVAVVAQFVSLRFGISVAIIEMLLGIFIGNGLGIRAADKEWLVFLAAIAGVILTFLAGAEVDNDALKRNLKPSLLIGAASFFAPLIACSFASYYLLGWDLQSSMLAGVALSETSVAIVYIILVEGGKSKTSVGSLVLCACFITDLGASIALCVLFVTPGIYLLVLVGALIVLVIFGPRLVDWCFKALKGRSGEPEVKVVLLLVMLLAALATVAGVSAVLPAYVLGLIMSRSLARDIHAALHMRTALMAFLGSFFFISAGMNVQLAAVYAGVIPLIVLFVVRLAAKLAGVGMVSKNVVGGPILYITWLMATALSFGVIFAQVGLSSNLINTDQFSILIMVIVMSAIIPTVVAQRYFDPWSETNGRSESR